MERITKNQLEAVVTRLNLLTKSPGEPWTRTDRVRANIGNYHLDYAYGSVALARMVNADGGITMIFGRGTKRELYNQIQAFIRGLGTGGA